MAVFPDHIVLKNTTDGAAATVAALSVAGVLRPGELCVRRFADGVALYALDANNNVASVSGSGGAGGAGGTAGTVIRVSEAQTAASGAATFTGIGASGQLVKIETDINAWVVFYPTAADRTADAARGYGVDPALGSGVLAEYWVTAGTPVYATPGTIYFNNDTTVADAIYVAVRDQSSNNVNAEITVTAFAHQQFGGVGLNRIADAGTASGGTLDLVGIGQAGFLVSIESDLEAWITMYPTDAARTADATRAFAEDPVAGDGVIAEWYLDANTEFLITPSVAYCNHDDIALDTMYLAVRDQNGDPVDAYVQVRAFTETSYSTVTGGTYGSG